MMSAREIADAAGRQDVRRRWLLTLPALVIIFLAAVGPLFVMLLYSFLDRGDYGGVKFWQFSAEGWFNVFLQRDIFDDTLALNDAHIAIVWRSVKLSIATTLLTLLFGFPTAYFIATRPRAVACDLAVPDHHSLLEQPADPHLCHAGGDPQ
jgi:spermidine/putrescine transport system permease protein